MQVIVVGGFLGSGKTTTIINMGKYLAEKGKKSCHYSERDRGSRN
ncbi:GTP-binding protein [Methanosarcina barkeri]|nr:GTP-binding protein [Methanosarcina barkeri]